MKKLLLGFLKDEDGQIEETMITVFRTSTDPVLKASILSTLAVISTTQAAATVALNVLKTDYKNIQLRYTFTLFLMLLGSLEVWGQVGV